MQLKDIIGLIEAHETAQVMNWLNSGGDPNLGLPDRYSLIIDILDELYDSPDDRELYDLLELFVRKGAILNFPDEEAFIPLTTAIESKCIKAVELFLENNADPNIVVYPNNYPKYTPLVLAVELDDLKSVKLLAKQTNQDYINFIGGHQVATALGSACKKLNFPIIKELLKNGANPYFLEWDHCNDKTINLVPKTITSKQQKELNELVSQFSKHKKNTDNST